MAAVFPVLPSQPFHYSYLNPWKKTTVVVNLIECYSILTPHKIGSKWLHVTTPWRIERNRIYAVTVNVMCGEWQVSSEESVHHFNKSKLRRWQIIFIQYFLHLTLDVTCILLNKYMKMLHYKIITVTNLTHNQSKKSSNHLKCMHEKRAIRIHRKW